MTIHRWRAALGSAAFLLLCATALPAQEPRPAVPPRGAAADTVPADSAQAEPALPSDPAADAVVEQLRKLEGFTATEYQGKTAVYRANEGVLRLQGSAEVARGGDRLTADTIVYRDQSDLVEAYGKPTVSGQAQELQGNTLFYDLSRKRATALGARTKVTQQATWYVHGDVTLEGSDRIFASHGKFTTCDLEIPHYHFESDKIKVVKDKYLVARPARLYFGRVPVLVLPFVVQSLERGRRSGLIVPKFSVNDIVRTSSDYTREISEVGWYWAINEYLGAQITGGWRSEAYTSMQGRLDYKWRRQFLDGYASFERFWQNTGEREFNLDTRSAWKPDERTDLSFQGRYASSSDFVRDKSVDPRAMTQDLASTFSLTRRFDWGTVGLGAERRQSIADGSVDMRLPRLSVSPKPITLFRAPTPEQASWYSNSTLQWSFSGARSLTDGKADFARRRQDQTVTQLDGGITQLSVGNLEMSLTGNLNQTLLREVVGSDSTGQLATLPGINNDRGNWQARIGYRQKLIGQTMVTPNINLRQDLVRDSITGAEYLGGPMRMDFGASMNTALFGFYPGIGPYQAIRHRISPSLSYGYSPQVTQSELQEQVFGRSGGRAQNVVSLSFNQTWEAKVRPSRSAAKAVPTDEREVEADSVGDYSIVADSVIPDSIGSLERPDTLLEERAQEPERAEKVTLLSVSTSPLRYDFVQAEEEGNGFVTERVSNTISSDYMKGLSIQMEHELFDKSALDPRDPLSRGRLGSFAPRLSSLSTSFELGPNSAFMRLLGLGASEAESVQGGQAQQAPAEGVEATGDNPLQDESSISGRARRGSSFGGSDSWNMGFRYSYTRPQRSFGALEDRPIQTLGIDAHFELTPNWSVDWATDYSITDGEFGTHRLNFKRDLHRWQANFSFYKAPNGNSAFEFFVELIDNRELKLDYRERNLGIDRGRRR